MQYIEPKIFDNVLDEQILQQLNLNYCQWYKTGWKSQRSMVYDHGHLSHSILAQGNQSLPVDLSLLPWFASRYPAINAAWKKLQEIIGDRGLLRIYSAAYHYGMDGYLHTDRQSKFEVENSTEEKGKDFETVILYMNKEWDLNWHGQTCLYEDNEIVLSCAPKYNRMFIFDANQVHSSAPLTRACNTEKRIIVFNTTPTFFCDPGVKYLIENTSLVPHSNRTFFEHLWQTYQLLCKQPVTHEIRLAGLWHAVYGTHAFDNPIADKFPRDLVKGFIGEEAEELVYRFCNLELPRVPKIINTRDYDLAWIEICNLTDQNFDGRNSEKISQLELMLRDQGLEE